MGKKKKGNKGVQIAVAAVAAVATVVTMGAAAPVVGAAILGEIGGAAGAALATETILGSAATYASVVGGAVIGAGAGALNGAAQASLVGVDLSKGALKGAVVGSVTGVAGLVGAGYASTALQNAGLGEAATAAITGGVKGATANVVGAEMQGRDPLTAGLAGFIGGAATPAIGGLLNEGNLPTTDAGRITAATLGGGVAGASRSALTGGDALLGAAGGAAMGGLGAYLEPQVTAALANTLFGGSSTTNVAEAVGEQLTRQQHLDRISYLQQVQQQYADRGDDAGAERIGNALAMARTQFEADLPRLAQVEQAEGFQQTTQTADITGRTGTTSATGQDIKTTINDIYNRNFGRDADASGAQYWAQSGLSGAALERAIIAGAQGNDLALYNAARQNPARANEVAGFYWKNFNRAPDASGLLYYMSSGLTGQDLERSIIAGAQGADRDYYLSKQQTATTADNRATTTADTTASTAADTAATTAADTTAATASDNRAATTADTASAATSSVDETTKQLLDLTGITGDTSNVTQSYSDVLGGDQATSTAPNVDPMINEIYKRNFGRDATAEDSYYWATSKLSGKALEDAIIAGAKPADKAAYEASKRSTDALDRIAREAQEETQISDIFLDGRTGTDGSTRTGTDGSTRTGTDGSTRTGTDGSTSTVNREATDGLNRLLEMMRFQDDFSRSRDGGDGRNGDGGDGGDGGGRTTTDPSQKKVVISPVYIDPNVRRRQARAAPSPVVSAGADPATSGVILGKYGKKDQVWNEATLRLADALGIR